LSINLGASTFWNPKGLSRPVMGLIFYTVTLFFCAFAKLRKVTITFVMSTHPPASVYAVRAYGVLEVQLQVFLISALYGGKWSAPHYGRFIPYTPRLQIRSGCIEENTITLPLPGIKPRSFGYPVRSLGTVPTTM
jgi:hypothetical protein